MTLYVIGIGLSDPEDITIKGLNLVKKCSQVYIETYTSRLSSSLQDLEAFYGKKITPVGRDFVERQLSILLESAKKESVALLIVGSPLAATTHIELLLQAKKKKVPIQFVDNASILTAVGITGLSLYKFGRVATIPFGNKNITSPIDNLKQNQKQGLHTLFLLDIEGDHLMTIREGIQYLIKQGVSQGHLTVACAGLGSSQQQIKVGKLNEVLNLSFTAFPQCLILPGELHFKEEEALQLYV